MHPDVVSLVGLLAGAVVVWLASLGGGWLAVAAVVVVVSGLLDNLDGAVAVLRDRVSAWGYVLDSVVDRVTDTLYVAALWQAGAPPEVAALGGALALMQEYARARAAASGMREIGVVTVWERPTRIIVTAMFLVAEAVGTLVPQWSATLADVPGLGEQPWASLGAWAWAGLGLVGSAQLGVVVRRSLSGRAAPGLPGGREQG